MDLKKKNVIPASRTPQRPVLLQQPETRYHSQRDPSVDKGF